jgi:hypothetical protein
MVDRKTLPTPWGVTRTIKSSPPSFSSSSSFLNWFDYEREDDDEDESGDASAFNFFAISA